MNSMFAQASSLVFPNNAPSNQIQGGYFKRYFENNFTKFFEKPATATTNFGNSLDLLSFGTNGRICWANKWVVWYYYNIGNILDPKNGTVICGEVSSADGNASGFTGALIGVDGYLPVYSNGGRDLDNSIITQNFSPFNKIPVTNWISRTGAIVNWHLMVGAIWNSVRATSEESGSRLFYEWVASTNSDAIYSYRYNKWNDSSWLRTVTGDNRDGDGFQLWISGGSSHFNEIFNPYLTITTAGRMVLSTDASDHNNISSNSPSLFVNGNWYFTSNLSSSGSLTTNGDITTSNGNFLAPNGWITVKNDVRATNGHIYGNNFYSTGKIYSTGGIETKWNILSSGSLTTNGDIRSINGGLTVSGGISSTNGGLTVKNDIRSGGNIYTTGSVFATGTLNSNGGLNTSGSLTANGDIRSTGGNLYVTNITTSGSVSVKGGITAGGNITTTGSIRATEVQVNNIITTSGATIRGPLNVTGPITTSEITITSTGSGIKPPAGTGTGKLIVTTPTATGGVTTSWLSMTQVANNNPSDFSNAMKNMFPSLCKATWTGANNTCYWVDSLQRNTTWWYNAAVWWYSMYSNTTWGSNSAFWSYALWNNTTWTRNVAIWANSLERNLTWWWNVAVGNDSLRGNTTWGYNVAVWYASLQKNTTWQENIAIWPQFVLWNNLTGNTNIAIGKTSLYSNVSWNNNIALGNNSLREAISSSDNISIGHSSMFHTATGSNNLVIGNSSLYTLNNGSSNLILGNTAGYYLTSGNNNVALGHNSLRRLTEGWNNTILGASAWYNLTSGSNNIAIGQGVNLVNNTGSNQLNIGNWIYGNNGNIGIGINNPTAKLEVQNLARIKGGSAFLHLYNNSNQGYTIGKDGSERLVINYDATVWSAARTILTALSNGNVGIGNNNPSEKLEVAGNIKANAYLYTSDERFKTNISTIDSALDKVTSLRGVNFDWKDTGRKTIGFIAQEVEKILPELVHTDSNGYKSVEYANITAILVEAIKEQQSQISDLKNRLDNQEKLLQDLQNQILELKNQK